MADTDQAIAEVYRKIEREKALINAATHMRQSTNNSAVQARVDSNIRDSRRNISYLEEKLSELQLRQQGPNESAAPIPPAHGGNGFQTLNDPRMQQPRYQPGGAPTPPPKDERNYFPEDHDDYEDVGAGGYGQGGTATMAPRGTRGDLRPYSAPVPKARPNFSKLGALHATMHNCAETIDWCYRSHQIRHSIFRSQDSTYALPARIQAIR